MGDVLDLEIDPDTPTRIFAATRTGMFRSEDAGETWAAAGQGLPSDAFTIVAQHPAERARLYAVSSSSGLFRSDDGAESWRRVP